MAEGQTEHCPSCDSQEWHVWCGKRRCHDCGTVYGQPAQIPASATHVVVPVDLFRELVTEAEVGYHGFCSDTDLWSRVAFTQQDDHG